MPSDKICKTVHQYNKTPVSQEDMQKLLDIAKDYQKVKNYVYGRYGGIGSLSNVLAEPQACPSCIPAIRCRMK